MDTMEKTRPESAAIAADYLREGYSLWEDFGLPPLLEDERFKYIQIAGRLYGGAHSAEFAAACQCFALFRLLHGMAEDFPAAATLLGDYFFSRFSQCLIPLNSVLLTNAFAEYLKADIAGRAAEYETFLKMLPAVIQS